MTILAFKKPGAASAIDQQEKYKLDAKTMKPSALKVTYKLTYDSWRNVKARCKDMGIVLDQRFATFPDFLYYAGPRTAKDYTLDRINAKGAYSPENCRWVDKQQQALNRSNAVVLSHNGETAPLTVWAKKLGVSAYTLRARKRLGWTDSEILFGKHGSSKLVLTGPMPWPRGKEEYWERLFANRPRERESREAFQVRICQDALWAYNKALLLHSEGGYDERGEFMDPTPAPAELIARRDRAQRALLEAQKKLERAIERAQPKQHRFDDLFPE